MELDQLRAFVAVAETGSFTRAAEALYTTHSSVSRLVSALERELDVLLIERDNKVYGLTKHGKILLSGAKEIIRLEQQLKEELKGG